MSQFNLLQLTHCRHFAEYAYRPCSGLNIITGPNASGKTTLLESMYVLAHGKSFRASQLDLVVRQQQPAMTLFAEKSISTDAEPGHDGAMQLGLQKIRGGELKLHINHEKVKSIKSITEQLPIQLITTESSRLFTDGPKMRRDFLAWGLFYTDATYYA